MKDSPIGIFDSGVGGTSIWKEIQKLLPKENTLYLADSKNAPYGEKSKEEIVRLSRKNTEFLLQKGCKLIVVACNTATTNAITYLRDNYDVPFIGIEPAIKPAALNSKSRTVGVLATKGTLASSLFHSTSENHAYGIQVLEQEGTGLVELIEKGELRTVKTRSLLKKYLDPMLDKGIDYLVLGCSHYPYLIPLLRELLPEQVRIIDSGEAVARQTKAILLERDLLDSYNGKVKHQFYSNTDKTVLKNLLHNTDAEIEVSYLDF
ncbi:glutamate racemase [Ulvibacterium marinum]|uniref:Glutamate racemase n=1 Tax=Ulvibacterium marinum TaxID=2419782 RepID=A0A3B0C2Z7_9FLAO|nr:glutamate racemase [Ulvibacterium marinum]RKN78619.1 glutamate racemase [Ulvibacterium marinum]